ncbi:MAG: dephospho-CoA kinase [Nitrospinae bacterium]|nr:dephospho-CoA kinase [Nitrospinota bacterium]MBL7019044.1 dephospho-CoA kinase [Nitrospinaceae bacterium]
MSLLIGLTGGIGSGKSLAAKFFKEQGAHIIDADQLSRDLVCPGQPALREIIDLFGECVLDPSGNLNREELAEFIFQDIEKKSALEAILHPKIIAKEQEIYLSIIASDPSAIVIIDAALLVESGNHKNVDKVIVVQSSEEQQVQRILDRSSLTPDQAVARIRNQMSLAEKNKYADFILNNQAQPDDLREEVRKLHTNLLKLNK